MTLLHDACFNANVISAGLLLQFGANLYLRCSKGLSVKDYLRMDRDRKNKSKKDAIKSLLYKYKAKY
jgi:hypothetical protein